MTIPEKRKMFCELCLKKLFSGFIYFDWDWGEIINRLNRPELLIFFCDGQMKFYEVKNLNFTYFWNSHSLLSNGHTWRVFNHLEMQWKWNACCGIYKMKYHDKPHSLSKGDSQITLQTPHATVHSSLVLDAWFAWHSIQRSMMWFRQIAQLSTTMSVRKKMKFYIKN